MCGVSVRCACGGGGGWHGKKLAVGGQERGASDDDLTIKKINLKKFSFRSEGC